MRYAVAVRMAESCVDVTTRTRTAPKRDWAVGDLRGIQTISQPISFFFSWSAVHGGFWLVGLADISIVLVMSVVGAGAQTQRPATPVCLHGLS